jgi:5S rRNA maturation endonuclease (ribonuclease M5)
MESQTGSKSSQTQIYQISDKLVQNLPELLEELNINYRESGGSYTFCCPVHDGDNPSGCSILANNGSWKCWTHHCEEEFKGTIFGFVRGVLTNQRGTKVTMEECIRWCLQFLRIEMPLGDKEQNIEYYKSIKLLEIFQADVIRENTKSMTREQVRSKLTIPSSWYAHETIIERNFSKEILDKFDVGDCYTEGTAMYQRAVVPVYDENSNYVGCLGRTLVDSPNKWKNEKNFYKENYLYGLNFAKRAILETGVVIIVEGQSCIWRLHEAGFINSVGIFGAELSDQQLILLEKSGAHSLLILTDNDDAGIRAANKIINKCGRRFNYYRPDLISKDIAQLNVNVTKEFLGEIYDKYNWSVWKEG